MNVKLARVVLLFIMALVFNFCSDDDFIDGQPTAADASKKRMRPTANAGSDKTVKLPSDTTKLDGSLSKDPDGFIKKYQWSKVSGPDSFSFSNAADKITLVTNLLEGVYTFRLTVTDDRNFTDSDEILITATKDLTASSQNIPTLSGFSPVSGPVGTTVILTGTNFGTSPSVNFNGTVATIIQSSATSITTTVPAGATSGALSVTVGTSTVKSTGSFSVSTALTTGLYFQGNMDNVSITQGNTQLNFNGWSELTNHPYIDGIYLNNLGGISYAFQEIRKDPVNTAKNVLYAQTINDDPNVGGTSRAQMTLGFKAGVNLPVYHTSHRMFLNPDIAFMTNYSSAITWFTLFEIWNEQVAAWSGDPAGSARWSLSINKASGTGQALYWKMNSEYMQPSTVAYNSIWNYTNKVVPIPLGKWFTLDLYMKRGEGSNGKMIISITPDGGPTTVLFDITNTTIYPGHPELQVDSWQPFKLYLDDDYLDWMKANNKTLSIMYNDFKWYEN